MNLILHLFPNNELRLCVQTPAYKRKSYGDKALDRKRQKKSELWDELRSVNKHLQSVTSATAPDLIPVVDVNPDGKIYEDFLSRKNLQSRRQCLLDILKKSQELTLPSQRWGKPNRKKSFTSNACHRILESGAVIDKENPAKTWMVTCTIPGSTPAALQAVAHWSGWIVNRMLQTIRDNPVGKFGKWFYVWEFQKRGALHMHWAVAHQDDRIAKRLAEQLEYQWFELLLELKQKAGVDCFERLDGGTHRYSSLNWQSNVQKVQKSVAAYYSKYVSKGSENQVALKDPTVKVYYPARWWGSSKSTKEAVKKWRFTYKLEGYSLTECELIKEMLWELIEPFGWKRKHTYSFCIEIPQLPIPVCSGTVQIAFGVPETWAQDWQLIKSLCERNTSIGAGGIVLEELAKYAKSLTISSDKSTDFYEESLVSLGEFVTGTAA